MFSKSMHALVSLLHIVVSTLILSGEQRGYISVAPNANNTRLRTVPDVWVSLYIAPEFGSRHNSDGVWGMQLLLAAGAALELVLRLYACGPSYCSDW